MDSQSPADSGGAGPHRPPAAADFPAGLRVLLVDDDRTCLSIVAAMLKKCLYQVTISKTGMEALDLLRKNRGGFDIVLSDVYMPDMDGFKLLEHIGLEMDLPVIMMSADDKKDVVMKGVTHGACDYLIKPVSKEALKNIWQHVFRKKRNELKDLDNSGSLEENDKQKKASEDGDIASSGNEGNWKIVKRKKDGEDEDEFEERESTSTLKKPRVVWSVDLHQQFVAAVNQLGLDKAVPKKILELMNNPTLTRENVASHLQKYRLYLKRVSVPQHQGRADASFPCIPDSPYSSITTLEGYELQAFSASGQLPPQALVNLQSGPRRTTNICMDMSAADQRGFFTSDAPIVNSSKIRPAVVQQVNNNQMNVLFGSPTSMEARQIGQAQQMFRSCGNMGFQVSDGAQGFTGFPSSLRTSSAFSGGTIHGHSSNSFAMQMNQQGQQVSLVQQQDQMQIGVRRSQSRGQMLNGVAGEHDSRVSSTVGPPMVSNGASNVLVTGTAINGGTSLQGNYMNMPPYNAVPQSLYPNVQNSSINGSSCHPHMNSTALANQTSTMMIQDAMTAAPEGLEALDNVPSLKGVKDVIPNFDVYNDLHQNKNPEWKLQNVISYESSQQHGTKQSNIGYGSQVVTHQDFNSTLKDGVARNTGTFRKERFLIRAEIEHEQVGCLPQDGLFADDISNELMSVFGRQPQEPAGLVEPDFSFGRLPFEA